MGTDSNLCSYPTIIKTFEGEFGRIYYNNCEACAPIGITDWGLCDIVRDEMGLDFHQEGGHQSTYPTHKYMGKKFKLTLEIYDSSPTTITEE